MEYTGNLLNLKTDLRSLKFDSKTPYVQKEIGDVTTGLKMEVQKRLDDVQRITKVLTDNGGVRFILNQGILNLTSNSEKKLGQRVGQSLLNTAVTTGIIIAQTGVAGTGLYLSAKDITGEIYLKKDGTTLQNLGPGAAKITDNLATTTQGDTFERIQPGWAKDFKGKLVQRDSKFKRNVEVEGSTQDEFYYTQRSKNYLDNSKEIKLGLGTNKPGRRDSLTPMDYVDRLNYLDVVDTQALETLKVENRIPEDIIPFVIEVYEPGGTVEYLYFRAYLETLSDNFNGSWNGTSYIGRAEEVFNYTGFKRDISFSFKIAAHSEVELLPLYRKLNRLVGTTAPSYSDVFMRGVFTKLTIGDYLVKIPGFFSQIGITWDKSYPWEVGRGIANDRDTGTDPDPSLKNIPRVPHVLDVNISFTPIHDFIPAYKKHFITNDHFIDKTSIQIPSSGTVATAGGN